MKSKVWVAGILLANTLQVEAAVLSETGNGEVLLFPFYTAQGSNDTYISIRNESNSVEAVKVRFLRADNEPVLDLNLYLAASDHWSAVVTRAQNGQDALLLTGDASCTVPAIPSTGILLNGATGTSELSGTASMAGSVQVFVMGTLGVVPRYESGLKELGSSSFGAAAAATPIAGGIPANCGLLRDAWLPGQGEWALNPTNNIIASSDFGGALSGSGVIINVQEGTAVSYPAFALSDYKWITANTPPGAHSPNLSEESINAYTDLPPYNSAKDFIDMLDLADGDGSNAVKILLAVTGVSSDYVLDPSIAASTDWVVYFPTMQPGDLEPANVCEAARLEVWDREGNRAPDQDHFLCHGVNILQFGNSDVLQGDGAFTHRIVMDENFVNGKARISFTDPDYLDGISWLNGQTVRVYGVPALSFAVQKYVNGNLGGVLSNYAGLVSSQYHRQRELLGE